MGSIGETINVRVDALIPYERNAKIHGGGQLQKIADSIEEFGFINPILIDRDMNIIAGHGRVEAAKQIGLQEVPAVYVEGLTEAQRRAYIMADNRLAELAEWDMDIVANELAALQELDFDIDLIGFDQDEDDDDLEEVKEVTPPDPPEEPKTKPGQMFRLGKHRLICGDSTDPEIIGRLMAGDEADLLLTDPPYNVDVGKCDRPNSSNNGIGIANDKMEAGDFVRFLTKALRNADAHMKRGAAVYVWYAGLHHSEFEQGLINTGFKIREQLIWVKSHFVLGRNSDYQWMHECCLYGWKPGAEHYFTDSRAEETVIEDKNVKLSTLKKGELIELCEKLLGGNCTSILRADKPNSADLHPTVKPQELLARLTKNSSRKGWLVLDPFGGSGSTLICCEQLGRVCRTVELDPKYCDVIIDRWEAFTGQKAEVIDE